MRGGRQPDAAILLPERLAQSWLMPAAYRFVASLLAMTGKPGFNFARGFAR
ncbi:MAG: hypothetical protein GQF41_4541 [Candidatus Rifleibacterium amylolyticum]|nr:MAG: hypothetical protein GQF41_4541 [Candidatus Rifleibacterium amylolyticum]